MSKGRVDTRYLIVGTILGLAGIMAFTTMGMKMGEDFAVPGLIALAIVGIVILKGPVGKAWRVVSRMDRASSRRARCWPRWMT